jgi:alpha/beta superfamily hydrolase
MKSRLLATAVLLLMAGVSIAAQPGETVKLETEKGTLEGTLLVPTEGKAPPVALIIAGSGPTDRDGNNATMKTNTLKMLATALLDHGIATLRYDKRGVGKSSQAAIAEEDLRIENFIEDAKGWIAVLKNDERFGSIMIIGHSQGSLLGMIAAQEGDVAKFISIAGLGQSVDMTLREQLASQPPDILTMASPILD